MCVCVYVCVCVCPCCVCFFGCFFVPFYDCLFHMTLSCLQASDIYSQIDHISSHTLTHTHTKTNGRKRKKETSVRKKQNKIQITHSKGSYRWIGAHIVINLNKPLKYTVCTCIFRAASPLLQRSSRRHSSNTHARYGQFVFFWTFEISGEN